MYKIYFCKYLQPKTRYKQTFNYHFTRNIKSATLIADKSCPENLIKFLRKDYIFHKVTLQ